MLNRSLLSGLLLIAMAAGPVSWGAGANAPTTSLARVLADDASLRDIALAGDATVWVVGDRGVVLVSRDGGRHWESLDTGTETPLLAVDFADANRGWIVGGDSSLYSHRSRGFVLRTIDGGVSWQQHTADTLPRLARVKFFDAAQGVACGYSSAFYPAGLFTTQDGGKSWRSMGGAAGGPWLAADFFDLSAGVLFGPGGRQAVVQRGEIIAAAAADSRTVRDVAFASPTEGWLVGDEGRVARTSDGGVSWELPPNLPYTPVAGRSLDWRTAFARGSEVWIAGDPGSVVLYSPDRGQTWKMQATGVTRGINRLVVTSAGQAIAVGELGMVLTSADKGATWRLARDGGKRAAIMLLAPAAEEMSLELLARFAGGEGYRAVAQGLFATNNAAGEGTDFHRMSHAIATLGGDLAPPLWSGTPRFDVTLCDTAEQLWDELNRETDGRARELLLSRLVTRLRTWRPDVVMVPHATSGQSTATSALVEGLAIEAIAAAADPTFDVELTTVAGLPPWQVKRVVGRVPAGERGTLRMESEEFMSALGGTPAQFARQARGLMFREHVVPPALDELELLWQLDGLQVSSRDPLAGLNLPSGGDARRPLVVADPRRLDELRQLATRRKQLVRLMEHTQGTPNWSAQVVNLTGGLDATTGGELLFQLAEGYRETGSLAMTANTLYLLARRYPEHPLTEQSLVWLVEYYASGELGHIANGVRASEIRKQPLANVTSAPAAALPTDPQGDSATLSATERLDRVQLLGQYLEQARPAVFAEPTLRFPLSVAARKNGLTNTAERYFMLAAKSNLDPAWQQAALVERWLVEPTELPPNKPMVDCRLVQQERPHLDGLLDEPMWQAAQPLSIGATDPRGRPTSDVAHVKLARDLEYLYVAIECPRLAGVEYAADSNPRTRDADLRRMDRVELAIDIDRDYRTAYELTIDCRGWTHDTCWGDRSWNPKWYVAHALDETHWRAEIAIPWSELADPPPSVRDAWCLSAVRRTPRGQSISWTGSGRESPAGFGLLIFR